MLFSTTSGVSPDRTGAPAISQKLPAVRPVRRVIRLFRFERQKYYLAASGHSAQSVPIFLAAVLAARLSINSAGLLRNFFQVQQIALPIPYKGRPSS